MSFRTLSVAEAKATLAEQIRRVEQGDRAVITRHGRAVAALVAPEDLETLARLRAAGPEGGLASIAGGWEGSEELLGWIAASPRAGSRGTPSLD